MRTIRFLPIAFLAGQHGFMLFAPYLAIVLAAVALRRRRRVMDRIRAISPASVVAPTEPDLIQV